MSQVPQTEESVSFVIPVYNEEETLATLFDKISEVMASMNRSRFNIIFVDDGSSDGSWKKMKELADRHPSKAVAIRLRRNFGKANALTVGFQHADGDLVFTLDADLQDDPAEIPRFIEKLNEGYDFVSGWKKVRHDPISKTLPSKFFNFVTAKMAGLDLHDFNCGFKAYRREVIKSIRLYGELHRYIPVLAHDLGFKVGEIPVQHHPRKFGVSKYGWERYARGFLDLLTVLATTRYLEKPGHFFGGIGMFLGVLGMAVLTYLTVLWFLPWGGGIGTRPLFFFGILNVLLSAQLISLGLIAELLLRSTGSYTQKHQVAERIGVQAPESAD